MLGALDQLSFRKMLDRVFHLVEENQRLYDVERALILKMAHIYQGHYTASQLADMVPPAHRSAFTDYIARALNAKSFRYKRRSLVITFYLLGVPLQLIAKFLGISRHAIREFVRRYREGQIAALLIRPSKKLKIAEREDLRDRLFAVMHAPPIDYDINRTTWTINLLQRVLVKEGVRIGHNTLAQMIRREGYNFRKTRQVLTSNDPDYRHKLEAITRILRRLGPNDRFFSVDEYGPFSIKQQGGRRRVKKGEYPTVPQYQVSKGRLTVIAALELSTNQVTHFYSNKKDTEEMTELLQLLLKRYSGCRRIYFSWDAASWHSSKKFQAEVRRVNKAGFREANISPMVKLAPLPARAQFLNVIESVFAGMSRSIIQNSDYESISAAKAAIDRYFEERNDHFIKNPRRAGNKIWGKELVPSRFSESHNCKDLSFMRLIAAGK
jgi:transposase